jgi:O-antigen/teichoic acid export membrane protein
MTLITFLYKLAASIIIFANGVLTARLLGKQERAEFQLTGTIATFGQTSINGLSAYNAYALAKYPDETLRIVQMGNLAVFTLALGVWGLVLTAYLITDTRLPAAWWWAFACLPFNFIFGYASNMLQGIAAIRWLNRINTLQALSFLVLYGTWSALWRVPSPWRLASTYAIWLASWGLTAIAGIVVAYRLLGLCGVWRWRFSRRHWQGMLAFGGWQSISNLVNYANYRIDFWMVLAYLPAATAADYAIAVTAGEVLVQISGSVVQVVFRRLAGRDRVDSIRVAELSARHTILSAGLAAILMSAVYPWFIPLTFGPRYAHAVVPALILLPGLVAKASSNIVIQFATNQLGSPKTAIWMNGLCMLINAALCALWLPHWRLVGAALASSLSYVAAYVVYIYWFGRINHVHPRGLYAITTADLAPYKQLLVRLWRRGESD